MCDKLTETTLSPSSNVSDAEPDREFLPLASMLQLNNCVCIELNTAGGSSSRHTSSRRTSGQSIPYEYLYNTQGDETFRNIGVLRTYGTKRRRSNSNEERPPSNHWQRAL